MAITVKAYFKAFPLQHHWCQKGCKAPACELLLIPPAMNARALVKTEGKEVKYILTNISNETHSQTLKLLEHWVQPHISVRARNLITWSKDKEGLKKGFNINLLSHKHFNTAIMIEICLKSICKYKGDKEEQPIITMRKQN
jgi:hypothetical protein